MRKLVGTVLLLALVAIYALAAVALAGAVLPEAGKVTELASRQPSGKKSA